MIKEELHPTTPLIINRPHLVSPLTKIVSTIVTIFFWGFFSYLWTPMLILIIGLFGYHLESETQYLKEVVNFKDLTLSYGLIVAALGSALLMWALQEYLRFRNSTRRRRAPAVELADIALYTQMRESDLATWQATRCMVAHHAEDGKVIEFYSHPSPVELLSA